MKGLGSGNNIWTGKKITLQDQAIVDSALEKAVLYKIMYKKMHSGEEEFRYHWHPQFTDHLNIMGEIISKNPGLQKAYEDDGSEEADFAFMYSMVAKYLAAQRLFQQREAGLPEWEFRSTSQVYTIKEINDEENRLRRSGGENKDELYGITRAVYGMLRYEAKHHPERFFERK